jgi:hypothetical protein
MKLTKKQMLIRKAPATALNQTSATDEGIRVAKRIFALVEVPNGQRQAPAKELITGSIPGAAPEPQVAA